MANRVVMGYWDCPSCGSREIRGDVYSCPNCGRARGEVRFYMKGHTEGQTREETDRSDIEYLGTEHEKYVNRGPDWYCSFCNSLNREGAETCTSCGASRSSSEANYFQMRERLAQREAGETAASSGRPKKKITRFLPLLLVLAAVLGALIWFFTSNVTRGDYEIVSLSWKRSISVQQYRLFQESGWSVPDGAQVTGQRQEIYGYNNVLDHYETVEVQRSRQVVDHYETYYTYADLGNGTFEEVPHERAVYTTEYYTVTEQQPIYRQVPEYRTKYYYDIWRWVDHRTADASGQGKDPVWPDPELAADEREGVRDAAYIVTIRDTRNNAETRYTVNEEDWRKLDTGVMVFITAHRTGSGAYISDEKGEKLMDLQAYR